MSFVIDDPVEAAYDPQTSNPKKQAVRCDFCYKHCSILPGNRGACGIRRNKNGKLETVSYGQIIATGIDPIEKKPFYHVYPGKKTYSIALFGCNLTCLFCQNDRISQIESPFFPSDQALSQATYGARIIHPEELMSKVLESGAPVLSFTYSEPLVWQDYMIEAALLAKVKGLTTCMVTNGLFSSSALDRILPVIDAFNIDVKGTDTFYRTYCGGRLDPVLQGIERIMAENRAIVEVTTLIIEGIHTEEDIVYLGSLLYQAGVQVWHLSRFFPAFQMLTHEPTSEEFLQTMLAAARASGIPYVYAGNTGLKDGSQTICPSCGKLLIPQHSYRGEAANSAREHIIQGQCGYCHAPVYGLFSV